MRDTQKHGRRAKHLQTLHWCMSSVEDVSHLSRRAKRRLYCKVQLWMWRKRRQRCRYAMFRAARRACLVGVHTQAEQIDSASPVVCHSGKPADPIKRHDGLQQLLECDRKHELSPDSAVNNVGAFVEAREESCPQGETCSKEASTRGVSQQLKDNGTFEHLNSAPLQREQAAVPGIADLHSLKNDIQGEFWKLV